MEIVEVVDDIESVECSEGAECVEGIECVGFVEGIEDIEDVEWVEFDFESESADYDWDNLCFLLVEIVNFDLYREPYWCDCDLYVDCEAVDIFFEFD